MILAPMSVRRRVKQKPEDRPDPEHSGEDNESLAAGTITLFKPVYVFDVSQTEGEPVPSVIHAHGQVDEIYPALQKAVKNAGITLQYEPYITVSPDALGVSCGGAIILRDDLPPADAFRTLAHEYAHELLHKKTDRQSPVIRETEADACAYYLLLHDANVKIFLERLETIRRTAATIITAIEDNGK